MSSEKCVCWLARGQAVCYDEGARPDGVVRKLNNKKQTMRHTIDFAEAEPSAHDGFAVAMLRQVNMTLIQAQSSAVMETLRQYEAQGVKALADGATSPWQGKEPWTLFYSLGAAGLTLSFFWFEDAVLLGWCAPVRSLLRVWWQNAAAKVSAGMQPAEAYAAQLEELRQRQTRVPWAKLEDVLSEEAERVFRRRLRDAIWDSLMLARPLKPGAPKETQEVFLTDLLGDLDAVEEISPVGGQIYQRYLWTADGRTTDDLAEAVVAELRAHEPQASASGRDLIRDCLSILLACGIDPLRAGRNNRVAYVSYQWPLE